jgi:rod shape determining protein RodA
MRARRLLDSLDLPTIGVSLALVLTGIFCIASALAETGGQGSLWRTQLLWLAISAVATAVVVAVDYHVWAEVALALHGVVLLLLALTLVFGREVGGNRSWLVLGPARMQPSELAKWTTCLVLAVYLARRVHGAAGVRQLIEMAILVGLPAGLVALQPDMGSALTFLPIFLAALLLGGVRWKVIVGLALIGILLVPAGWMMLEDYQKERIITVFDPERDPSGFGYQVRQSRIAIGSGGLVGNGMFEGTQSQLEFLPARHTDFVLAVFAEQFGFLGVLGVLALFYYLFHRGIVAARSSQDRLGTFICMVVVAWLAGQVALNIGVVLGRFPTIGVPLPLMSYGGSSLLATLCCVGLIVNVRTRRFVN